jgi:hypothetical protein
MEWAKGKTAHAVVSGLRHHGQHHFCVGHSVASCICNHELTGPSFCTSSSERVYITAIGCEIEFGGARELQAAGAGGL